MSKINNCLIGGTGLLGPKLSLVGTTIAPPRSIYDLSKPETISDWWEMCFERAEIDTVILSAAYTNVAKANTEKDLVYEINVNGIRNSIRDILYFSERENRPLPRIVYISTDYVFNGKKGNYHPRDSIDPVPNNYYALTKALGEMAVRAYPNHLVIRTSFCDGTKWPYEKAFDDQFTSRDTVDIIAPKISALINNRWRNGIIHVGTERKSVYDLAKRIDPNVKPMSRLEIQGVDIPYDTSLYLDD